MDKVGISGLGNSSQIPQKSEVSADGAVDDVVAEHQDIDTQSQEPGGEKLHSGIDPSINPALFHIARRAVLNTEVVSGFITDNARELGNPSNKDFENTLAEYLRRSIIPDKQFESEIKRKLSGVPFDLVEDLKRRITSTESLTESAVMLKMLFCLGDKDEIFQQLMIPYLEERSGLGDSDIVASNKRFYLRFFKALHEGDLEEILLNLRYQEVIRADNFAYALLEIAEPRFVLDTLEKYQVDFSLPEEDQLATAQKVQTSQLTILQNGTARAKLKEEESLQYLETLYKASLSQKVSDDIAKLFSFHYAEFSRAVFLRELENTVDDVSEANRRRRYLAVTHLVNAINNSSEAADYLKGFILKEKDPFVVGNAVYLLSTNLGEDGKKALVKVIVEQSENEIVSLPLGCLNLLYISKDQKVYLNLIKDIFSFDYKNKEALRTAFENLADEPLCPISKENGDFLFAPAQEQDPEQVVDLIGCIEPETFFQWALTDSKDDEALRRNSQGVLDYACVVSSERVYSFLSWILTNGSTSISAELTRKLGGMGQAGRNDEVVEKIRFYSSRN